jgi:hypothetical protein
MTNENCEYQEISLLKNPILTLQTLSTILIEQGINFIKFITKHKGFLVAYVLYFILNFIEGIHGQVKVL